MTLGWKKNAAGKSFNGKNNQNQVQAAQLVCTPPWLRDENVNKKSVPMCPETRVPGQEKKEKRKEERKKERK